MSDEKDDPKNISHIDNARVRRLQERGHLMGMLEDFEILRIKFYNDKLTDKQELIRFITLVKYFKKNGPTEAIRLSCQYLQEKYLDKYDL